MTDKPTPLLPCPFCGAHLNLMGEGWDTESAEERFYSHPVNDCPMFSGWEFDKPKGWNRRSAAPMMDGDATELFWWWAPGSVARHSPNVDYQVIEKHHYDALRSSAQSEIAELQRKLREARNYILDIIKDDCPYPVLDDPSILACVTSGKCGCGNAKHSAAIDAALDAARKDQK